MLRANVQAFQQFDRVTDEVERLVVRELNAAAEVGAEEARRVASARSDSGLMASFKPIKARGTADGYASGFANDEDAWYDRFQNDGTLGSRTRQVKASTVRRRQSASGQARYAKVSGRAGIQPLRFLEAGRKKAVDRLKAGLRAR